MTIKYTDGSLGGWLRGYDSFTAEYLQAGLAYERLIREYHGTVRTVSTKVFSTPDSKSIDDLVVALTTLIRGSKVEALDAYGTAPKVVLFVGEKCVVHLAKPHNEDQFEDLFIADATGTTVESVLETIRALGYTIGVKGDINGVVPVTFCTPSTDGVSYTHRDFAELTLESVRGNYAPEVIEAAEKVIAEVGGAKSGIVILNGEPGTGKSYLIRALLSELRKRHAVICTPPARFLMNVDLLVSATQASEKPSLMVLEDIGDLLAQDNVSRHLDETSNFLNLTDGLLSLLMDTIFIVSFNHDMSKINPALTRPGRCLGQITVGNLPLEQVRELVGTVVEVPTTIAGEYTLAEAYEMKRTGRVLKAQRVSAMPGMR